MRVKTPDPFVHTPEPFSAKIVVKTEQYDDVGAGGIVYDMDVVNSTKRRKIVIKKDTVKPAPLKIEVEEGEVSDGDHGDGADGDGLANVRW